MRELFLHPVVSGQHIAGLYKRAFAEAVELYVLSAYLRSWDTELKINKRCRIFMFFVGKDFGITRKRACIAVLKWLPRQRKPFFLVADGISGFHPKALFWRAGSGACYALIGSSNLSEAGLTTNYEPNAFEELSANQFEEVRAWVDRVRALSLPMSRRWLDEYQEATPRGGRKSGAEGSPPVALSAIVLPTFRGQQAVIHRRRAMKRRFVEIRSKLLSAIRRCAAGKISDAQFYDRLEQTWGSHYSRMQGWGWQVKGRDSDFKALCRGIVSILNSDGAERDLTVVQVIDDLKAHGVPTRRALLSELLCLFFPDDYPVLNKPVAVYTRPYVKAPYRSSEGERYLHLTLCLRAALQSHPRYPAKDLLELDGMIWKYQDMQESD